MKRDLLHKIAEYTKDRRNKIIWYRVVTCLAAVVVFCTTYALILPAITMERDEMQMHTNSDAGYTQVTSITHKDPICSLESLDIHEHTDECYDEGGELICGYADFVVHEHDENCYDEDGELWCPLPEIKAHTHVKSCYAKIEEEEAEEPENDRADLAEKEETESKSESGHVHTEDCYEIVTVDEPDEMATDSNADQADSIKTEKVLICGKTESSDFAEKENIDPAEEQSKESSDPVENEQEAEQELLCDMEEIILHKHTEQCFDKDGYVICGKLQVLEHKHTDDCFDIYEEPVDPATQTPVQTAANAQTSSNVQTPSNALEQGNMLMMLPTGAQVPSGYDVEFSYIDPDNRFGVLVYAPEGALPENAVLIADLLDEGSDGYVKAEEALETLYGSNFDEGNDDESKSSYDGFVALDIRFEVDGEEVEPAEPVYVCINIFGLLPDEADPNSVEVQHHAENTDSSLFGLIKKNTITAEKVADTIGNYGVVEVVEDEENDSEDSKRNIMAAFEINGFSTFTATYSLYNTMRTASGSLANNVFAVDAVNTLDPNANVILVYPQKFLSETIAPNKISSLGTCFGSDADFTPWYVIRIEKRGGRYQVLQAQNATKSEGVQTPDAYLLLVKKTYMNTMYHPYAEWDSKNHYNDLNSYNGDTAHFNLLVNKTDEKSSGSGGSPYAYVTFSPVTADGFNGGYEAKPGDVTTVEDSAIKFQLFDYGGKVNYKNGNSGNGWREITPYFSFRGGSLPEYANYDPSINNDYDEDGFTPNHATVERTLTGNYPILDLTRRADGGKKTDLGDKMPSGNARSLAYLFGGTTDAAVTVCNPTNTILQKDGTRYYYDSADNAVDYDPDDNVFRVREYTERNSSTVTYDNSADYYDFLPFNYTDGQVIGTYGASGRTYNLDTTQVNYWFGMRMDVNFYQYKDGQYEDSDMVFNFSGDDDVWVFIDDVLVLDLGGTHGCVTGSINFATGEIKQYLDWDGEDGRNTGKSYPTTIKECFTAAGKVPSGGWNQEGTSFADYSSHKMSFFYMERGSAVANCSLDFNLPTLPDKALQVTKNLVADEEADANIVDHLKDTMTYKFRVVKADANGDPTNELLVKEGDSYTLYGTGISEENRTGTVGEDGYFTLRSGQTAEFSDMMSRFEANETYKYYVQELLPNDLTGQYEDVAYTVGSKTGICIQGGLEGSDFTGFNSPLLEADISNLVAYTNTVDTEKLSELQITKEKVGSALTGEPEFYLVKVSLGPDATHLAPIAVGTPYFVGDETRTAETEGIIKIRADETAKVKLLAGTSYYVEEVTDTNGNPLTGSEGYQASYTDNRIGTVEDVMSTITITITNTYPTGALEISKTVSAPDGINTSGEFHFELRFEVPDDTWTGSSYHMTHSNLIEEDRIHSESQLTFTCQESTSDNGTKYYAVASLNLYKGEKVTIKDIPTGTTVTINEVDHDGYSVKWKKNGESEIFTDTITVTIPGKTQNADANGSVTAECINTTGYELPATGGSGTKPYTMGGSLFAAIAGILLMYSQMKRRKEEFASL